MDLPTAHPEESDVTTFRPGDAVRIVASDLTYRPDDGLLTVTRAIPGNEGLIEAEWSDARGTHGIVVFPADVEHADDYTLDIIGPAVDGCPFIGPEDGCCGHPDNVGAECWRTSDGCSSPCPLLARRQVPAQAHR